MFKTITRNFSTCEKSIFNKLITNPGSEYSRLFANKFSLKITNINSDMYTKSLYSEQLNIAKISQSDLRKLNFIWDTLPGTFTYFHKDINKQLSDKKIYLENKIKSLEQTCKKLELNEEVDNDFKLLGID